MRIPLALVGLLAVGCMSGNEGLSEGELLELVGQLDEIAEGYQDADPAKDDASAKRPDSPRG